MPNPLLSEGETRIFPPDDSLKRKLGNADLDQLFSSQAIAVAQQVIVNASDQLLDESLAEGKRLGILAQSLGDTADKMRQALLDITDSSFSLKAKAGLGGYDLISVLAKSLHRICEILDKDNVTATNLVIIRWHIESLKRLLDLKIKGAGGEIGVAIMVEMDKLVVLLD